MNEYYQLHTLNPSKLPAIQAQIWSLIVQANLHHDLHATETPDDFNNFLLHVDGYLCELKDAQIRDGLHTLGQTPEGEQRIGLLLAMLRLDNGAVRSLRSAIATMAGVDYQAILETPGARYTGALPPFLTDPALPVHTHSDVLDRLEQAAQRLLERLAASGWDAALVDDMVAQQLGRA